MSAIKIIDRNFCLLRDIKLIRLQPQPMRQVEAGDEGFHAIALSFLIPVRLDENNAAFTIGGNENIALGCELQEARIRHIHGKDTERIARLQLDACRLRGRLRKA